jgi:hypothetical protein
LPEVAGAKALAEAAKARVAAAANFILVVVLLGGRIVVEIERGMERHVSEYPWSVVNRFGHFKDFLNLLAFVFEYPILFMQGITIL